MALPLTRSGVVAERLAVDHLGRRVVGAAAGRAQEAAVPHHVGQAKVRDLDVAVAVEEEVFRFQVTMDYVLCVTVIDPHQNLPKNDGGVCFFKEFLFYYFIEIMLNLLNNFA